MDDEIIDSIKGSMNELTPFETVAMQLIGLLLEAKDVCGNLTSVVFSLVGGVVLSRDRNFSDIERLNMIRNSASGAAIMVVKSLEEDGEVVQALRVSAQSSALIEGYVEMVSKEVFNALNN